MPKPYTPNDKWSQRATREGYRARSVYKLQEIDEKLKLIKKDMKVLDLGAAPGSWLQYAAEKAGEHGTVLGIDVQEIQPLQESVITIQGDITDEPFIETFLMNNNIEQLDLIISDLAPKTSGIRDVDQWKSIELSQSVLQVAERFLKPGGKVVIKVLRGADFDEFFHELKRDWNNPRTMKVKASRDRSNEIYVIATK